MGNKIAAAALTARLTFGTPVPMPPTKEEARHLFTGPQEIILSPLSRTETGLITLPTAPPREPNPDFIQQQLLPC